MLDHKSWESFSSRSTAVGRYISLSCSKLCFGPRMSHNLRQIELHSRHHWELTIFRRLRIKFAGKTKEKDMTERANNGEEESGKEGLGHLLQEFK